MISLDGVWRNKIIALIVVWVTAVVLLSYYPSLGIGFLGDDWSFLWTVASTPPQVYLTNSFNPFAQVLWYRPLQNVEFMIEYRIFGGDPVGYHVVQMLLHLSNCLMLFALVTQNQRRWRVALIAALIFAGLPVYGWSAMWAADATPLQTFFYLLAIFFWGRFLRESKLADYLFCFGSYILALLSKEASATLPVVLFLMDWLLTNRSFWVKRWSLYIPFLIVLLLYLPLEYIIQSRSHLGIMANSSLVPNLIGNLISYLVTLSMPWSSAPQLNYAWFAALLASFIFFIVATRRRALVFLLLALTVTLLPFAIFAGFNVRYTYMPAMIIAILLAVAFEAVRPRLLTSSMYATMASVVIALIVFGDALSIRDTAQGMAELARLSRLPLQTISQRHPAFPDDTYLYFINPSAPASDMSGMLFLRYGSHVTVRGVDLDGPADLRAHKNSFVYYRDDSGQFHEQQASSDITASVPSVPVNFDSISLEGYELVSSALKRDQAVILFLYWRVAHKIDKDFAVFVHLVAKDGRMVTGFDSDLGNSSDPASLQKPGEMIRNLTILPVADAPADENYSLELGIYDRATMQRLSILDDLGRYVGDHIVIEPIHIIE